MSAHELVSLQGDTLWLPSVNNLLVLGQARGNMGEQEGKKRLHGRVAVNVRILEIVPHCYKEDTYLID